MLASISGVRLQIFAATGNQAPDNRRPLPRKIPQEPVFTGFFMILKSWFGTCFSACKATSAAIGRRCSGG